jgi:hypothetical protein
MTVRASWPHRLDQPLVVYVRNENGETSCGNRVAKLDEVHAEPAKHLTGQTFDIEHAEQNVPGGHLGLLVLAREPPCSLERSLCPRRERQRFAVRESSSCAQCFDHLVARRCQTYTGRSQHVCRFTVII